MTDIYKDGTMNGPNLVMLDKVNRAVSCNIIASGGVGNLKDIVDLNALACTVRLRANPFIRKRWT